MTRKVKEDGCGFNGSHHSKRQEVIHRRVVRQDRKGNAACNGSKRRSRRTF